MFLSARFGNLGGSLCCSTINKLPCNGGVHKLPCQKGGRRTAVPVISLSQLSFAVGAVIFRAIRQALFVISAVYWLDCVCSQSLVQICLTLLFAECIGCCWWLHQQTSKWWCHLRPKVDGRTAGTRDVLVAVVLRFRCGDIQCDAASVL